MRQGTHALVGQDFDLTGSWRGPEVGEGGCGTAGGNTLSGSASDRYLIPLWEGLCENATERQTDTV